MHPIYFSPRALRDLKALSPDTQKRIQEKLKENSALENPLLRAKPLVNLPPSTHRFRVGKYRVSFHLETGAIFVDRIEIRDRAY